MAFDFPNSPSTGQRVTGVGGIVYVWDGVKWTSSIGNLTVQSMGDIGRNLIHNPLFNVAQRGAGPWIATAYTADRWGLYFLNGTAQVSILAEAAGAWVGDESGTNVLQCNFAGSATAGSTLQIYQPIEGVRRLSGKTVTASFWASASVAGLKLGLSLDQGFGTGGSPSAGVPGTVQAVTLSTTPTRYSLTFNVPSVAGKTLGTNGNDATTFDFLYSSQAVAAVGVQSGIIQLWGVQLEVGSVATPLEKPDPRYDLANCQRFYQWADAHAIATAAAGGAYIGDGALFAVQMRGVPTLLPGTVLSPDMNIGTVNFDVATPRGCRVWAQSAGAGQASFSRMVIASADL